MGRARCDHSLGTLLLCAALLCLLSPSHAAEYFVNTNFTGESSGNLTNPYSTIQAAVAQALPGDTVSLLPGRHGVTSTTAITADKAGIMVRGLGDPSLTAIYRIGFGVYSLVTVTALANATTVFQNLTFSESSQASGAGVQITGSSLVNLTDCRFQDLTAFGNGGGMLASGTSSVTATRCVFTRCKASIGSAVAASASSNVTLTDCSGSFNLGSSDFSSTGILAVSTSARLTVTGGSWLYNRAGLGLLFAEGSATLVVSGTLFMHSFVGARGGLVYTVGSSRALLTDVTSINSTALSYGGVGAAIDLSSQTYTRCTLSDSFAAKYGGAFFIGNGYANSQPGQEYGAQVILIDSSVANSSSPFGGAVVNAVISSAVAVPTFVAFRAVGSSFSNCTSQSGPVLLSITQTTVEFMNCTFSSNRVTGPVGVSKLFSGLTTSFSSSAPTGSGGAFLLMLGTNVSVIGGRFSQHSGASAGVFWVQDSSRLTVRGATVLDSAATDSAGVGGVLYALGTASVTFLDCELTRASAAFGGMVYAQDTAMVLLSDTATAYGTATRGGAVYLLGSATLSLERVRLLSHSAQFGGALLATDQSTLTVSASEFRGNVNPPGPIGVGAAVLLQTPIAITFVDTLFALNNAGALGNGGALYLTNAVAAFENCSFSSNTAGLNGGAVYLEDSPVTFSDCRFDDNSVPSSATGLGGAVFATTASVSFLPLGALNVTLSNCTLSRNAAGLGGALAVTGSITAFVAGSTLTANRALFGGAVYMRTDDPSLGGNGFAGQLIMTDSTAQANNATTAVLGSDSSAVPQGGALWISAATFLTVASCSFTANSAVHGQGGAWYVACPATSQTYSAVRLTFNSANAGGAVYSDRYVEGVGTNGTDSWNPVALAQDIVSIQDMWFEGNTARHGRHLAADGLKLEWTVAPELMISTVVPTGDQLALPNVSAITGQLLDIYHQPVTWSSLLYTFELVASYLGPFVENTTTFNPGTDPVVPGLAFFGPSVVPLTGSGSEVDGPTAGLISFPATLRIAAKLGYFSVFIRQALGSVGAHNINLSPSIVLRVVGCPPGQTLSSNGQVYASCRQCPPGTYNLVGNTPCLLCPDSATCLNGEISADPGYYLLFDPPLLPANASLTVESTPLPSSPVFPVARLAVCDASSCLGGNVCRENQLGPLCAQCEPGFAKVKGLCQRCTSANPTAIFLALFVLWLFICYLVFFMRPSSAITKILTFFVQTCSLLLRELVLVSESGANSARDSTANVFSVANLELFQNTCIAPLALWEEYLVILLSPAIMFALYVLVYALERLLFGGSLHTRMPKFISRMMNPSPTQFRYRNAFVSICLFLYAPIMRKILDVLSCSETYTGSGDYRLNSDRGIECSGYAYGVLKSVSIALCVVFVYPLPIALFAYLKYLWGRKDLTRKDLLQRFSVFLAPYRHRYHYWEAKMQMDKTVVVTIFVFGSSQSQRLLGIVFVLVWLVFLQVWFKPMASIREDRLQMLSYSILAGIAVILNSRWFVDVASTSRSGTVTFFTTIFFLASAILAALALGAFVRRKLRPQGDADRYDAPTRASVSARGAADPSRSSAQQPRWQGSNADSVDSAAPSSGAWSRFWNNVRLGSSFRSSDAGLDRHSVAEYDSAQVSQRNSVSFNLPESVRRISRMDTSDLADLRDAAEDPRAAPEVAELMAAADGELDEAVPQVLSHRQSSLGSVVEEPADFREQVPPARLSAAEASSSQIAILAGPADSSASLSPSPASPPLSPSARVSPSVFPALAGRRMSSAGPVKIGDWEQYLTDDGVPYFHNTVTGETTWAKPE